MAVCTKFVGGYLVQVGESVQDCTGYILVTADEYASYFEVFNITPSEIATAITFGFSVVITAYFSAYPIGLVKKMLNKL